MAFAAVRYNGEGDADGGRWQSSKIADQIAVGRSILGRSKALVFTKEVV